MVTEPTHLLISEVRVRTRSERSADSLAACSGIDSPANGEERIAERASGATGCMQWNQLTCL